jgi:hypothetical protein
MIAINVCVDAGRWILFEQGFVSRVRGVDDAVAQCGALWTTTAVFFLAAFSNAQGGVFFWFN